MAEYDNTNTFTLFKNDKGDNPKRPDYTGIANVDGIEFRISGWIRESAKGKFISGSVQLVLNLELVAGLEKVLKVSLLVDLYN